VVGWVKIESDWLATLAKIESGVRGTLGLLYTPWRTGLVMVKGLKPTSSPIQISALVTESAANVFTSDTIDLTLNVLDNEVFVVTQINIDVDAPDAAVGATTLVDASVSTTARTTVGSIANQNVLGAANRSIIGLVGLTGYAFDREDPLFAAISEDYLGIIATNNAFLNIEGTGNGNAKVARCRIYGFRATASSSTYAALVQSELLSA
jgi:hypothetical protein